MHRVSLLLVLALLCATLTRATAVTTPSGSLSGRVVDVHGKPVAGAIVQADESYDQPGSRPRGLVFGGFARFASGSTTTEADGTYVIRGLSPLFYDISLAGPPDLLARTVNKVRVTYGQTARARDLIATHGAPLTGRVLDADTRKPIAGARLRIYGTSRLIVVDADDSGAYKARVLPEGVRMQYDGGHSGYVQALAFGQASFNVPPSGLRNADILVKHAELAKGTAVDETGKPMQGATVNLFGSNVLQPGATDVDGMFHIWIRPTVPRSEHSNLDPVLVRVETADHALGVVATVKHYDLLKGRVYTLHSPLKLEVMVKRQDGAPLEGAEVSLASGPSGFRYQTSAAATTGVDGRLRLSVYEGDQPTLAVTCKDYFQRDLGIKLPIVGSAAWKDKVEVTLTKGRRMWTLVLPRSLRL